MSARIIRHAFALVATAMLAMVFADSPAAAETAVKFSLDGRIDGVSAPFFVAVDRGYYQEEDLDVSIEPAATPAEPITRVAAGGYDMGIGDINALIRWRDQNPGTPMKAVFIVYNTAPYSVIGRKSRDVASPKDLEGKRLGAPVLEPASAQWPIFAKVNGIDVAKMAVLNIGLPVREPMLAAGEVDAITGVSFGAPITLREKGVPANDISVLLMADYGLEVYGNTILVNSKFLAEKPDAVKGFLRAFTKALKDTAKEPANAIGSVMTRNGGLNRQVELERLRTALNGHIITPEVKANGLGGVDAARFERALEQLALIHGFKNKLKLPDIFDESFLPPEAERTVD